MATVQIVLDKQLLRATDQAARRLKRSRSALVREALREHLRRLQTREMEQQDRKGYSTKSRGDNDSHIWEAEAAWPPACSTVPPF